MSSHDTKLAALAPFTEVIRSQPARKPLSDPVYAYIESLASQEAVWKRLRTVGRFFAIEVIDAVTHEHMDVREPLRWE